MAGEPPLERGHLALRNVAVAAHALAQPKEFGDEPLGDARSVERLGRLAVVVGVAHGEVEVHAVVALPAFSPIPAATDARAAVGLGGRVAGLPELGPILTGML